MQPLLPLFFACLLMKGAFIGDKNIHKYKKNPKKQSDKKALKISYYHLDFRLLLVLKTWIVWKLIPLQDLSYYFLL